ncbi:MAG: hypothetical protein HY890_07130 [Deltaproteobacteria bacterium]|nr:hypothetical protein [Deltaproteobacteria bacterium]
MPFEAIGKWKVKDPAPYGAACKKAGFYVLFFIVPAVFAFAGLARSEMVKNTRGLCIECHPKSAAMMGRKVVHRPVEMGLCTSCHNPHASRHTKLISSSVKDLCYSCHEKKRLAAGAVVHAPVEKGDCLACHDAHSSDHAGLLKEGSASAVCYSCHPKDVIAGGKRVHPEVAKGNCLGCHSPHSSQREGLLIKDRKALCVGCHAADSARITSAHGDMPVIREGTDCVGCHNPHSSDNAGILRARLHRPFAEKKCQACHSSDGAGLREAGSALCVRCHEAAMPGFNARYSHLVAGAGENPCTSCHTPHSADTASLMRDKERRVCYACHSDTLTAVRKGKFRHARLDECSSCHTSHGSSNRYFMARGNDTCVSEKCHPTQGRFTHPVGERVLDPRTKSPMNCATCHNPMSSPEESILRAGKDRDLCIVCHQI